MAITVAVGSLNQVIELQRLTTISDEFGFQQEEWVTYAKPRARTEFDDRLMRENFKNEGIDTTAVKIFTFRFVPGVTEKDRILFKGESYELYGINNMDDANRFIKVWGRKICQ